MSRHDDETKSSVEYLRRGLALGEGFGLHVVSAEQLETREALVRALKEDPALAVAVVDVAEREDAGIDGPIEDGQRSIVAGDRRKVVLVTGLEELAERVPEVMTRLNEHRNELRARIDGAVVLLGTPVLQDLVQHRAPDVWSARTADLELAEAPPSWQPPPLQSQAGDSTTTELSRLLHALLDIARWVGGRDRIRLMRLAANLARKDPHEHKAPALYEQAAKVLGDPVSRALVLAHAAALEDSSLDAVAAADTAIRKLDKSGAAPPRLAARAWSDLAHAWQARGRLDEAWEASRSALDFASICSSDIRAEVLARHAELLTCRGWLSEALALWDEVLPQLPPSLRLDFMVRAGATAALAGRGDRLDRYWQQYLALGGRPQQLDAEIDALGGAAAELARERLAASDSVSSPRSAT